MEKLPVDDISNRKVKQLLTEKANHYERVAFNLMNDESSTLGSPMLDDGVSALTYSPRSLLTTANKNNQRHHFFSDDSSVATVPIKIGSVLSCTSPKATDNIASEANAKLAVALDLDEDGNGDSAISAYMEAAEVYLRAIQMTKSQKSLVSIEAVLKIRMGQILDRVEELKHPLKKKKQANRSALLTPTKQPAHNALTADEVEVLKKSSLIASGLFLPWSDQDAAKLAVEAAKPQPNLFSDPDGYLPLSDKQQKRFHRWARPTEILRIRQQHAVLGSVLKPAKGGPTMVKSITPYTIQQQYVTDCSFIASLCICATFERRFQKRLVTNILFPQDNSGELMLNPNGKYMVKLWLNGVARCVVIDDYLPIDKYGNLLCSQTTHNNASSIELWVCLIEKAYMKLCGGYDFPGSNSGVDLFSLTGWIPERIHFAKDATNVRDYETPPERAWERILSANSYGDCLITVSTQADLSEEQAEKIGLVTGHAYAVLAVVQTKNGTRLLQLKNPWAHKSWKGRFSSGDIESWRGGLSREVGYDPDIAAKHDDGVFWICWDDILFYFQNFHLSWNPALFQSRLSMHGCWPREQGPPDDTFNIGENPQYCLELSDKAIKKNATIWILVSRHVTKQEQEGAEVTLYIVSRWCQGSSRTHLQVFIVFCTLTGKRLPYGAHPPQQCKERAHLVSRSQWQLCAGRMLHEQSTCTDSLRRARFHRQTFIAHSLTVQKNQQSQLYDILFLHRELSPWKTRRRPGAPSGESFDVDHIHCGWACGPKQLHQEPSIRDLVGINNDVAGTAINHNDSRCERYACSSEAAGSEH